MTELSHDKQFFVGHNEFYEQVLIPKKEEFMGKMVQVQIKSATKFSMIAEPVSNNLIKPGLANPLKKGEISGHQMTSAKSSNIYYAVIAVFVAFIFRLVWILFNI